MLVSPTKRRPFRLKWAITKERPAARHGHRDATMILVAYRHGLRATELCDLQWHQIELDQGRLHVRRAKRGTPSVHPIRGDEIRALRRLRREHVSEAYVFISEPRRAHEHARLPSGSARPQRCPLRSIRTCCGTPAASSWPMMATTPARCRPISATGTSSTQFAIPSWRATDSETSGDSQPKRA